MKSEMVCRSAYAGRWRAVLCALACTLCFVPKGNAQTFYSNVPDFFQHQKWGTGDNKVEDPEWEKDGGWCFYASTINQFFFLKKKGYNGLLINDTIADPPKWLPASSAEIKQLVSDYDPNSKLQKDCKGLGNPLLEDETNCILADRGAGPDRGIHGGLVHQYLQQIGTTVQFLSSDGTKKRIKNTTLFTEMQKYLRGGDSLNLRLGHIASDKVWWSGDDPFGPNFHSVTVAGVDLGRGGRIWFADPDSNPDHNHFSGNTNDNSGWKTTTRGELPYIRLRRFVGNEQLPVPVNNPPTQTEIDQRYFVAVMQTGGTSFDGTGADFDRYNDTDIVALNIVEIVKGAAKGPGKPAGLNPASRNTFEVTPGGVGNLPIDEFWVFSSTSDQINFVDTSTLPRGWQADLQLAFGLDAWGNDRPYGWMHVFTPQGLDYNPLKDTDVLDVAYDTFSHNPLAAWDVMFAYQGDPANLRVQVFGGRPMQVYLQVNPGK